MVVSNAFNFYSVYNNELYPTQIRIIGLGFLKTFGSTTTMVSSQILNFFINNDYKIMILFSVLAGVNIVFCYFLP